MNSICSVIYFFFSQFVQFYCSQFVQFYCSQFVQLFCSQLVQLFCFAIILLCAFFVERDIMIFLTIFFSTILFLMWCYTITIKGEARNVIEMCSMLLRLCCTDFGLFMTAINMLLHVSVYGTCFYISGLYISTISFILQMVVSCAAHVRSKVEVQNILMHSYINITIL